VTAQRRRVVLPAQGCTKLDVVDHFVLRGDGALRDVSIRPTMLKRWTKPPQDHGGLTDCFSDQAP
jgi:DNA primase